MRQAVYEAGTVVGKHCRLALTIARVRGHGVVLAPGTDVVIEGYPRSANSFAVAAFGQAQPTPVRIAHHTHAPGHVVAATKAGVPALILIRDPADACLEFVMVKPFLTLRQALRGYIRFYQPLLPLRDRFVVGAFQDVTTDFGAVMERVNAQFGTAFTPFDHTEENVRACIEAIDGYWRGRVGPGLPLVGRSASDEADRLQNSANRKDPLRRLYHDAALARPRAQAEFLFRALSGRALESTP